MNSDETEFGDDSNEPKFDLSKIMEISSNLSFAQHFIFN